METWNIPNLDICDATDAETWLQHNVKDWCAIFVEFTPTGNESKPYKKGIVSFKRVFALNKQLIPRNGMNDTISMIRSNDWETNAYIREAYLKNADMWRAQSTDRIRLQFVYNTLEHPTVDFDRRELLDYDFAKELVRERPFYVSTGKRLPKSLNRQADLPAVFAENHNKHFNDDLGEIHNGQLSFIDPNDKIYNWNSNARKSAKDILRQFVSLCDGETTSDDELEEEEDSMSMSLASTQLTEMTEDSDSNKERAKIRKILKFLSDRRAKNYDDWVKVIASVKSIFVDDIPSALMLAQEFSKRDAEKYSDEKWRVPSGTDYKTFIKYDIEKYKVGLSTLKKMLEKDNAKMYKKLFRKEKPVITDGDSPLDILLKQGVEHGFTVNYILTIPEFRDRYVYSYNGKGSWYELNDQNVWVCRQATIHIGSNLKKYVIPIIEGEAERFEAMDDDDYMKKEYFKLLRKLRNNAFVEGVKCFMKEEVKVDMFESQLNANPMVMAFKNGLYDASTQEFRPIRPDDYISIVAPVNFVEPNPAIQKWYRKLFHSFMEPTTDTLPITLTGKEKHFRKMLCYPMFGSNPHNKIIVWKGFGSNGKSTLGTLLQNTLGQYVLKLAGNAITTSITNHNGHSALAKTRYRRYVMVSEPNEKQRLQSDTLKELSGNEYISARPINEAEQEFLPQFTLMIMANEVPRLSTCDDAMKRRLKDAFIPFPYQFKRPHDLVKENECHKPVDETLDKLLATEEYKEQFVQFLIRDYIEFHHPQKTTDGCPPEFNKDLEEYEDENDDVAGWVKTYYHILPDTPENRKKYKKPILTMFQEYQEHSRRYNSGDNMRQRPFYTALRKYVESQNGAWYPNNTYHTCVKPIEYEDRSSMEEESTGSYARGFIAPTTPTPLPL